MKEKLRVEEVLLEKMKTIVSRVEELLIDKSREELTSISGQKKDIEQSYEVVMKRKNQNFILMKNEETLSQRGKPVNLINVIVEGQLQENVSTANRAKIALEDGLQKDKNAKCVEEGDETDLSHDKENPVIELNRAGLVIRFSQGDEGQLLKVVKEEEEHVEDYEQHHDEVLETGQVEDKLMEYLLGGSVYEYKIAVRDR